MTQRPAAPSAIQRTPLSAEEKARAEVNFVPYVAQALAARGRFQVTADTIEMVELFQGVARRVGAMLGRPLVSYANGEEIVITFDPEEPRGLTGHRARIADASGTLQLANSPTQPNQPNQPTHSASVCGGR